MLMVLIVNVTVLVGQRLVFVFVLVTLRQVQVDPQRHERASHEQPRRDRFVEHEDGQDAAEEGGEREVRPGSCRAEVAQGDHEQHETQAVADEAPTTPARASEAGPGPLDPRARAMATFTVPATEPLSIAICTGSAWEILRVRLLSMAQARHAPAMASGPKNPPAVGAPPVLSVSPPATIAAIPRAMRRSKFS